MNDEDNLLFRFGEITGYLESWFSKKWEYTKLDMAERSSRILSLFFTAMIITGVAFLALVLAATTLGLWLGKVLDSYVLGFGLVTALILFLMLLLILFRKPLILQPILNTLLQLFLYDDEK